MKNQNDLIQTLNTQLQKLKKIRSESGYDSFIEPIDFSGHNEAVVKQAFFNWLDDTSQIIKMRFSPEKEKLFHNRCIKSMKLKDQMSNCIEYLKALIDKIENNPEYPTETTKKFQNENIIIKTLNNMHVEVIKIAKDRIQHKEGYRGIISDVCTALESYIKQKVSNSKIQNIGGAKLMEHVFSKNEPIIIVSDKQEEQKGFMFLFSGVVKAVRNKCTHKLYKLELQEVLEILGFFSFLFKVVDKGKVKKINKL